MVRRAFGVAYTILVIESLDSDCVSNALCSGKIAVVVVVVVVVVVTVVVAVVVVVIVVVVVVVVVVDLHPVVLLVGEWSCWLGLECYNRKRKQGLRRRLTPSNTPDPKAHAPTLAKLC